MRHLSIALVLLCSIPVQAADVGGYVVKADSGKIYLDLGAASGVAVGQNFVVYTEGEELKHPITGASLGRIENELATGHIEQIEDKYSVGAFEPKTPEAKVTPGEKVRMLATFTASAVPAPAAPVAAPAVPTAPVYAPAGAAPALSPAAAVSNPAAGEHAAVWKSPAMDFEAVAFTMGDIDGDGKPEVLLASETHIAAYPQTGDWKPVCEYDMPATGTKILSLDAADIAKKGHADVFVTYFNGAFGRVETAVLECKNKAFENTEILPYMVRTFQNESGSVELAAQELIDDATFPFGGIHTLVYRDGKYVTDAPIKAKRVDWIYGFVLAKDAGGDAFPIYTTTTSHLRAQFKKRAWVSKEDYEETGSRLRWKDRDQLLMFRPRLVSAQDKGNLRGVYVLENQPGLGSVGGAFGYFTDAKLQFLQWDGLSLQPAWSTSSLGGYAADLAMIPDANGQPSELWVAVVSSGGRVSVEKFLP